MVEMSRASLDDVIRRLLDARSSSSSSSQQQAVVVQLAEGEIRELCSAAKEVFLRQPNLLELQAPISICGDVHGQFRDLLRIFHAAGLPPRTKYLFLGDYVDRGHHGIETICLLLAFKLRHPENLFLLRGNHECASINRIYGFYDECKRRYTVRLWRIFADCFNCMPVAALVDARILALHGGISPHLRTLDQIARMPRPAEVPDQGLLCDLLWSDPAADVSGWAPNHERGVSCTFGPDVLSAFLRAHDLDLLCRAHQVVEDGYQFFADRKLVTVFSAPNYCGEFDNDAAVMAIDADLVCSFHIIKPLTVTPSSSRGFLRGPSSTASRSTTCTGRSSRKGILMRYC
ncbi:hypothetical protein U9M48_011260 [Paspalum notatum var. saurae]|uniref:Serine/threonine-protein phosphatase n=1 Tax=Paspalum notatum var. saurae TaxID=547442 RepID=A0AAQ3SUZ1_PASNO